MTKKVEVKQIAPTTLGRKRAEYDNLRQLDGITDKLIKQRMAQDAKLLGVTLEQFIEQIDALSRPSGAGKREADKQARDDMIIGTQNLLGHLNELKLTGHTSMQKLNKAYSELCVLLHSDIGRMTMLWSPTIDFSEFAKGNRVEINPDMLCAVYVGGWEDSSKNLRYQYAPRKVPISKRSGYRDDSFEAPVYQVEPESPTPEPES